MNRSAGRARGLDQIPPPLRRCLLRRLADAGRLRIRLPPPPRPLAHDPRRLGGARARSDGLRGDAERAARPIPRSRRRDADSPAERPGQPVAWRCFAWPRGHPLAAESGLVLLLNPDAQQPVSLAGERLFSETGGMLGRFVDVTPDRAPKTLAPGQALDPRTAWSCASSRAGARHHGVRPREIPRPAAELQGDRDRHRKPLAGDRWRAPSRQGNPRRPARGRGGYLHRRPWPRRGPRQIPAGGRAGLAGGAHGPGGERPLARGAAAHPAGPLGLHHRGLARRIRELAQRCGEEARRRPEDRSRYPGGSRSSPPRRGDGDRHRLRPDRQDPRRRGRRRGGQREGEAGPLRGASAA